MAMKLRRGDLVWPALILVLAVVGVVAFAGSTAHAVNVSCGDTITADTTLDSNLVNCPNNGIVIGADDVTLDLNGHTIDGTGRHFGDCGEGETCDSGVLDDGHDDVTVMNGSVRQFKFTGLNLGPGRQIRVLGVSTVKNHIGILLFRCSRSLVRNSSGMTGRVGLWMLGGRHDRVLHSSFRDNHEGGIELQGGPEVGAKWPTYSLIKENLISGNDESGIVAHSKHSRIRQNRIVRGGDGINFGGNQNVIARNRISRSRGFEGIGISLGGGRANVIARNAIRNASGPAISVGFNRAVGNVVRRNHIHRAGQDGVYVDNKAKHTLLKRNHTFGAKDDGLDVNDPKTKLTRNEARRNGGLGIEAVPGVIDGGGNIARHNGDPRQCTNIVCN